MQEFDQTKTTLGMRKNLYVSMISPIELLSLSIGAEEAARHRNGYGNAKKGKPKISTILKNSKMPQIIGNYISDKGACALGVIGKETNSLDKDGILDIDKACNKLGIQWSEFARPVVCPEANCGAHDSVYGMIPHLNDVHKKSNHDIGVYLEQYDL